MLGPRRSDVSGSEANEASNCMVAGMKKSPQPPRSITLLIVFAATSLNDIGKPHFWQLASVEEVVVVVEVEVCEKDW